ncbi:MAG: class I SAM-dependent methyltransferase family protein [Sulfolobales archaeon]
MNSKLLRNTAVEILGEELGRKVWKRIDIIGDIAVIRKPFELEVEYLRPVAERLLERISYIKSVWLDLGGVEGVERLRKLMWLAGERRSETLYREHGCVFKLDITKVYVSPRLSYEHIRIARLVRENEFIINMFAGVGSFSIIIAKHARPRKVVSIDISKEAYRYMVENIRLNKVESVVEPVLGDSLEIVKRYRDSADRVLLPLPALALRSIELAVEALRGEGYIHPYDFIRARSKNDALEVSRRIYSERLNSISSVREFSFANSRIVRSVGPRRYQVVHDIWVKKSF